MAVSEPEGSGGSLASKSLRAPEKGKFYAVGHKFDGYISDVDLANENELIWEGERTVFPPGKRPSNPYPAVPRLEVKVKRNSLEKIKLPRDLDAAGGGWLISDRLKQILENVDPSGFFFVACDFTLPDGTGGPKHYLCDVSRTLDALDESASVMKPPIFEKDPTTGVVEKIYDFAGLPKLAFREDIIGQAHTFRLPYRIDYIFCDHILRNAVMMAGRSSDGPIRGIGFRDAADM